MLIEVALMVVLSHQRNSVPVYHVRSGDTLTGVAEKQCHGQPDRWTGIYAASRARHWTARNANLITVGQKLAIDCQYVPSQLTYASQPLYRPSSRTTGGSVYVRTGVHRHRHYGGTRRSYQGGGGTYRGSSAFKQCVIARESGGNARAVNPKSGAGGLFQFLPSTWHALGHSGLPENASVAEQNAAFNQAYAQSGTSPWSPYDGC